MIPRLKLPKLKLPKLKLGIEIKIAAALIGISFLVAFGSQKQSQVVCQNIVVELENTHNNYFITKSSILKILAHEGNVITGKRFDQIDLRALEKKLKNNLYIADAQLYGNIKGTLIVNIKLRRPIARLLLPTHPDLYITEDGALCPSSDAFAVRTLLISGEIVKKLTPLESVYQSKEGLKLMKLLQYIEKNKFWKAQVAQLDFDEKGKIVMYPQVTGQRVEFGLPIDIDKKFEKLMLFYKKILPQKGWTKYHHVNLEYENQIIAE